MELEVGIEGYLTSSPGVGGTIKASPEDFVVEEISTEPPASDEGLYTVASIRVRDWETNRLVRQLARRLRISRRRIGFAGTKDKRAVTTRLFSFERVRPEELQDVRLKDVEGLTAHPASKPARIGELLGNRFRIVVRGLGLPRDRAGSP